jgi:hypothetical protein
MSKVVIALEGITEGKKQFSETLIFNGLRVWSKLPDCNEQFNIPSDCVFDNTIEEFYQNNESNVLILYKCGRCKLYEFEINRTDFISIFIGDGLEPLDKYDLILNYKSQNFQKEILNYIKPYINKEK